MEAVDKTQTKIEKLKRNGRTLTFSFQSGRAIVNSARQKKEGASIMQAPDFYKCT